ncbi:HNH endonuclease signature motif containing protein [Blastococcus haudaquaticus]|uniref:HNH nuclease domain-containing protein n=1 Tax=Blastococcus haudaquaticus TaxID=1938745 RepID=A0A286GC63_9ACTN|nr:HNH endonuclease signature motif containing protein [Blastococcus haudaquaticus]SOD93125.1 protein of unknown function [Blastococcus haudaquaticus]
MFEGGGFGVGVTVNTLDESPWPPSVLPPGVVERPTRLGELLPVAARTDAEIAVELQRIDQVEARLAAYRAELVAELAGRRPDSRDRQIGEPGAASPGWLPGPGREAAPGVSEFFADELAMISCCSRTAATRQADLSVLLVEKLSGTWAAMADGQLDRPRGMALAAELLEPSRDLEPQILAAVEAAVLPGARELSIRRLQAAVRAELLRHDPAAADRRREQAARAADVTVRPMRDGMAQLSVFLPQDMADTISRTLDGYARMAKADGDSHGIGQLRVGVLYDLVTRPWDTSRPPVTAHLTVLAPLGALRDPASAPTAELGGEPITAAHLRSLLEELDALCPGGLQAPAGGTLHLALTDPVTGALRAVVARAELERLARRGCARHPDSDAHENCGCPVLDRPPPVDRYRPSAALRRFVTTRDRTCRHPGCRNTAGWADLDHTLAHADGGATDCENLCCLCRRHHRLKTHAPGWTFTMTDDGVLTVTTPSGVTRITRPPGYDDETARAAQPENEPAPF